MLDEITLETFESIMGETVELTVDGHSFQARVGEVSLLRDNSGQSRQPFSVFLVAESAENRGQRIYELSHPELGDVGLFMVPLGPGEEGMRYQIVFN